MSNGNEHEILVVYSETSEAILNIHLRYSGGYRIGISFIDNQGSIWQSAAVGMLSLMVYQPLLVVLP